MSEPTTPHPLAIEAAHLIWRATNIDEKQKRIAAETIHTTALQPVMEKVERYIKAKYAYADPYDHEARYRNAKELDEAEKGLESIIEWRTLTNPQSDGSPKINSLPPSVPVGASDGVKEGGESQTGV